MEKGAGDTISDDDLIRPIFKNGRYMNPFDTWEEPSFSKLFRFFTSTDHSNIPSNQQELDRALPIVTPDNDKLENPPQDKVQMMWIGHASVLVQFDGLTLITDPVFSDRCGPWGWMGPKRFRQPPCKVKNLPPIDAVLVSHNHYDHLDHEAVKDLNRTFGDSLTWFVAEGQAGWMKGAGCKKVVEMTWWQESVLEKNGKKFTVASTPCQHWCKRTATDINKALWSSWVVNGPKHNFYFAGDTGYCRAFKQIGQKYGPFSLAAIPIGAYEPRFFLKPQHVNPEEAMLIHQDIKSKQSVGIHWGTFTLSREPYLEPKQKIAELLKEQNLPANTFITVKHGDVIIPEDIAEQHQ